MGKFKTSDLFKWQGYVAMANAAFMIAMPAKALEMYKWPHNGTLECQARYLGVAFLEYGLMCIGFSKTATRTQKIWGFWTSLFFVAKGASAIILPQSVQVDLTGAKFWTAFNAFFAYAFLCSTVGGSERTESHAKWSKTFLLMITASTLAFAHLLGYSEESVAFYFGNASLSGSSLTLAGKLFGMMGYFLLAITTGYMIVAETGNNHQRQLACYAQAAWTLCHVYYLFVDKAALAAAGGVFEQIVGWCGTAALLTYMLCKESNWRDKVKIC